MLTGVHQRPPRVSWQCCIFPSNRTKTVLHCKFKSPVATPKGNISTRFASGNVELLTAQPIRFLRRNAGFGRLMIHYSSNAGISLQRPQNLLQVWDFPKICPQNTPRGAAVLDCAVFLANPTSQNYFFSAFFPPRTGQGRLSSTAFLRGLALGDRCAGKKTPPCPGKITPFPGRGLFWHHTRWQKNTFGDARAFSRQQSCWQKSTFGDARPFPGRPQKLAEKNPALAKKHPVPVVS